MKRLLTLFFLLTAFLSNAQNNLDKITGLSSTTASVAYSLRQLSSSYSGPLVRIKVGSSFYDVYPDASTTKFSLSSKISAAIGTYNAAVAAASASNTLNSLISGSTDATVAIWYDQSGNGVHVLSSSPNAKIITAGNMNTMNGQPTINFTGTNSYLTSSVTVNYSAQTLATINAVAQDVASTNYISGILSTGDNGGWGLCYDPTTTIKGYWVDASGGNGALSNELTTEAKIVTGTIGTIASGTSSFIYINGTQKGTKVAQSIANGTTDRIYVGSRGNFSGRQFVGKISETMMFPKTLSAAEQAALESSQSIFLAPSVTITSSASGAVCAGTNITFTATVTGLSSPTYQWTKNEATIPGATASTYSTTTLSNNDQIKVYVNGGITNANIVSNGLKLNLDASNPGSYAGAGTTWYDLSGNNNHATLNNSPTYDAASGSIVTNGTSQYLAVPLFNNSITNVTMQVWVYINTPSKGVFIANGYGNGYNIGIGNYFENDGSNVTMLFSNKRWISNAGINYTSGWHLVTMVLNGSSTPFIYIDNALQGSSTGYPGEAPITPTGYLTLGAIPGDGGRYYAGKFAAAYFYDRALSLAEIQQNYDAFATKTTAYSSNTITTSITGSAPILTVTGDGCINKTTLSTPTGAIAYAWYKDNAPISGATSNTYSPTTAGDYKVQVTSGSCSTTSTATTIFNCGNNAFGKMVALTNASSIISPEGGANFGTGKDNSGKLYNTTGLTTTSGTIGSTTAVLGGVISTTNAVTSSIGIVYSTDANFGTYSTTTIQSNVIAGTYTSSISGLSAATAYYAKAYVTNRAGTTYGSVVNFTTAAAPLTVGSIYGGGIVFYILQSGDNGYDANVQHGLIAPFNSISRQSTNPLPPIVESQIGKFAATISGALNNGTLLGRTNTDAIIANQGSTGTYAALYCRNYANPTSKTFNGVTYTFTVYNDWYMPSIVELNKFRAYVWGTHPSRGVYANYGNNVIYYNGTSGNGNDYAWGKYLSSTMTGQRYKLYYLESGNEDGSAAYNGWTESDRLVVMPIRSF
jgi:hypothetical protein